MPCVPTERKLFTAVESMSNCGNLARHVCERRIMRLLSLDVVEHGLRRRRRRCSADLQRSCGQAKQPVTVATVFTLESLSEGSRYSCNGIPRRLVRLCVACSAVRAVLHVVRNVFPCIAWYEIFASNSRWFSFRRVSSNVPQTPAECATVPTTNDYSYSTVHGATCTLQSSA